MSLKARIEAADVYALSKRTPLTLDSFNSINESKLWLKREDLQDIFSFKIRGAANALYALKQKYLEEDKPAFVVGGGNLALAATSAATYYNRKITIVIPSDIPKIKLKAIEAKLGNNILIKHEGSYGSAIKHVQKLAKTSNGIFLNEDFYQEFVAGYGTIAKEILEQLPRTPQEIYVCVGSGSLLKGVGAWIRFASPETKIIGVVESGHAFQDGQLLETRKDENLYKKKIQNLICDELTHSKSEGSFKPLISEKIFDELLQVSSSEILEAIKSIYAATRVLCEPSGALALAGYQQKSKKGISVASDAVVLLSGANGDFSDINNLVNLDTNDHLPPQIPIQRPRITTNDEEVDRFENNDSSTIVVLTNGAADQIDESVNSFLNETGLNTLPEPLDKLPGISESLREISYSSLSSKNTELEDLKSKVLG